MALGPIVQSYLTTGGSANGTLGLVLLLAAILILQSGWGAHAVTGALHELAETQKGSSSNLDHLQETLQPILSALVMPGLKGKGV